MKVLIQNTKTGKYLAANGEWVVDEREAADLFKLPHQLLKATKGRDIRAVLYFPSEEGKKSVTVGGVKPHKGQLPSRCLLKPLEAPDTHYLRAAEGWCELGNIEEANKELERITPLQRVHPEVLKLRAKICFGMGKVMASEQ